MKIFIDKKIKEKSHFEFNQKYNKLTRTGSIIYDFSILVYIEKLKRHITPTTYYLHHTFKMRYCISNA